MAEVRLMLLYLALLGSSAEATGSFDCGEDRTVDKEFICDGDEDCFWGTDESLSLCLNHTETTGSRDGNGKGRRSWLAEFLDREYLKVGGCGQPDVLPKFRERRLVGAELSIRGSWPWQTALVKKDEDHLVYCGGTLIHRRWVLTAAHCIESLKGRLGNLELWFGRDDVTSPEVGSQTRKASKVFKHPNHRYPAHKSNDIALIKLAKPVRMAPYIHLACLPTAVTTKAKARCYLAGWGRTSERGEEIMYPTTLMQLPFPMVPHKLCTAEPAWGPRITNKQICAGGDGEHDMCWGDSGGGLVCSNHGTYAVYGISSFTGHLCAVELRPAVFTKVDRYLPWISDIIKREQD